MRDVVVFRTCTEDTLYKRQEGRNKARQPYCCDTHVVFRRHKMDAPTTPLKWSTKKSNNAAGSSSYHLKSPTAHRTPGGGSQHSSNGGARSIKSNVGSGSSSSRMNAVFCDVVVEGVERNADGWDLPPGERGRTRTL